MKTRTLGRSGLQVSVLALGCNNFGFRPQMDAQSVVDAALESGITLFDTAESYGNGVSEQKLGAALGKHRADVYIATKWTPSAPHGQSRTVLRTGSRDYITKAVHRSLRNLQTDYIDLYQFHEPDPITPIEETLRTLDDLVRAGTIRYYGVSKMPAWQVSRAHMTAKLLGLNEPVSCQDEYSLLQRSVVEPQLAPMMNAHGLGLLTYFPLASGLLTGKYRPGETGNETGRLRLQTPENARIAEMMTKRFDTDRNTALVEQLNAFAEARGHTLLELAFSWLLAQPSVTSVLAGATRPEQVRQNAAAVDWELSAEELRDLDGITGAV
jgi:aryl-alcohol dehydrogenase-like predicted oxidoreductase